jgi:hypothetical protein
VSGELPLPTRDPFSPEPLVVTRLESAAGVAIEGRFTMGWIGRLTPEQLNLVGLLLARRNNLQQLAADLGVAYNTIRARFDDIVEAVERGAPIEVPRPARARDDVLGALARGEIDVDEAEALLRRR